ncbi:MAG: 2-amino-3-ketobutyrate coenzyme A ligase [uncultured Chloroflexia bacterium]|uniref:2-amino-3-ketobutyrate coenzyme A ligase n=1 Tax=uncultured Chloroflexia bacterium TaxID=1672391 RepID=A0A6J4IWU7_9CHLR|nr:MAG: 2-amino-3-ketobutyrate coenzyme A ligase [uncultured Chloroflexia bacterium]
MAENFRRLVEAEIDALKAQGVYRTLRVLEGEQRPRSVIDGREVINLSSNNYLGLTLHPKLREAAKRAIDDLGVGSGAVRTIIGTMEIHEELERRLAEFKHTEAVLVLQSGFTANAAVLGPILGEKDLVISDALNHASIIDGVRLTKAARRVYKHSDMDDLERVLEETKGQFRLVLIVSDGVFSMDGDIAPLPRIAELAEAYGAVTMVDDAHSSGVLGDHGRGSVSHFGLDGRWDIQVGTLSKAIGSIGGYVACIEPLRRLMEHRARPFLFSTSHPPSVTATCLAAVDLLESDEGRQLIERLWSNTRLFKAGLAELGFNTGASETPITPVIVGEPARSMQFSDRLLEAGVFAQGIAYPTVARDAGRVRTIVTAAHSEDDLHEALNIFEHVGREMGLRR